MRSTTLLIIPFVVLGSVPCVAQSLAQELPAFEVASIRTHKGDDGYSSLRVLPNGGIIITNASLRSIIVRAYELNLFTERFTLITDSDDILAMHFDIQARPAGNAAPGQHLLRLQRLLAERFNLRVHREVREVPIYTMTLARDGKLGPDLRRSNNDCLVFMAARRENPDTAEPRDVNGRPLCTNAYESKLGAQTIRDSGTLDTLVKRAQAFLDRPLVDATELKGSFEWAVSFAFGPKSVDSGMPSIFTAFQEQLGLRLQARTGSVEVLVIDSVEAPTPN